LSNKELKSRADYGVNGPLRALRLAFDLLTLQN
jgi:hypothetical protein